MVKKSSVRLVFIYTLSRWKGRKFICRLKLYVIFLLGGRRISSWSSSVNHLAITTSFLCSDPGESSLVSDQQTNTFFPQEQ